MHLPKGPKARSFMFSIYLCLFIYFLFQLMTGIQTELTVILLYMMILMTSFVMIKHKNSISRRRGAAFMLVSFIGITLLYVYPGFIVSWNELPESTFLSKISYYLSDLFFIVPRPF